MQILVHTDADGMIVDVHTPGILRLFDETTGDWRETSRIAFELRRGMLLTGVREQLAHVTAKASACRTFVSGENRGLVMSLLQEEHGFRVWKATGALTHAHLTEIAAMDARLAEKQAEEARNRAFVALIATSPGGTGCSAGDFDAIRAPKKARSAEAIDAVHTLTEPLGDGRLRLDLSAVLARYKTANSFDVLEPVLAARRFSTLEIFADHLPKWFGARIAALGLACDVTPRDHGVRALVSPAHPS